MMKILLMILFLSGTVSAAPIIETRAVYSTSLNTMAAILMNWYGSLIPTEKSDLVLKLSKKNSEHFKSYPKNITAIKILSNDLEQNQKTKKYHFQMKVKIIYQNNQKTYQKILTELFIFHVPLYQSPELLTIQSTVNVDEQVLKKFVASSPHYFKIRHFAYNWLAFMDDVSAVKNQLTALENTSYSLVIGNTLTRDTLSNTLEQRKKYITKGGHLLKSAMTKKLGSNLFLLKLIIEWKGISLNKPGIAKIQQDIEYRLLKDGKIEIISIKEKHLLPSIKPWTGLLC